MLADDTVLEASRRRIVRTIALGLIGTTALLLLIVGVVLVISPSAGVALYGALVFVVGCGALSTFLLVPNQPAWRSLIPLQSTFFIALLLLGILLPEMRLLALPFSTFIILLTGLGGQRRLTLISAVLISVMITVVNLLPAVPGFNLSAEALLPTLSVMAPVILVLMIWLVLDRILQTQNDALLLADHRASEAERAHQEVSNARTQAEQRNTELVRSLDLVETLELPVLNIGEHLLAVPLVGHLDSRRLAAISDAVLHKVAEQGAHTVVFDITGIAIVDTAVAQGLVQTAQAIRLLGARSLISGIRPAVAQTISDLGIDLGDLHPVTNLQEALLLAEGRLQGFTTQKVASQTKL